MKFNRAYKIKAVIVIFSIFFVGLGITLLRFSMFGTDPFNAFNFGVAEHFGFPLTVPFIAGNIIFFIPALIFFRDSIGLGTIINWFGCGTSADIWRMILTSTLSESFFASLPDSYFYRLMFLLLGIVILGTAASFYMAADMGLLPYDAVPFIIQRFTKWKFRWARVCWDSIFLILAVCITMLDGTTFEIVGIGTLFLAVGLGPILNFVMDNIARPAIASLTRGK